MSDISWIMNSKASKEPGSGPAAWLVVDDKDATLTAIDYVEGQSVEDAVAQFKALGALPRTAEISGYDELPTPYPWQIDPYRWTLESFDDEVVVTRTVTGRLTETGPPPYKQIPRTYVTGEQVQQSAQWLRDEGLLD